MFIFTISEFRIKEILKQLTKDQSIKDIVDSIVFEHNKNYCEFMYIVFTYYTLAYRPITESLDYNEMACIVDEFKKVSEHIVPGEIIVADLYDVVYFAFEPDQGKFSDLIYDHIYTSLSKRYSSDVSKALIDDVIDVISSLFSIVENYIYTVIEQLNGYSHVNCIYLHMKTYKNELVFCVFAK